mmetsp:Transcript_2300/g.2781  ORF Transcript_2300/g.2781 Transcript_2300/m.2781 type:complete len:199 (-) Transcript_2300:153-749(-)|eukprot:CAMPEP_0203688606 /NCGR_PEP_ID=MMETSP0091-20130426/1258_1 /ASSEMBLY_ACC=CAM_ASM_001089 /TAXON_ID=426623 /ORGANISM="Chaetoceros affinis, Strain CCMP159" /LENGTH=198 /DNA_ID=CAMNT_0050558149 /DNA_START=105 /DNA_END=701 /DNA_ORIENTATION=+
MNVLHSISPCTSTERHLSVPKEILIKTSPEAGEDHVVDEKNTKTVSATMASVTHMEWDLLNNMSSSSRNHIQHHHRHQQHQVFSDDTNGCIVSLSSSDTCNASMSMSMSIDPLDYRKDWSNDLTVCMSQNPQLFMINKTIMEETKVVMSIIPDDNSLCSNLSEEYEMEADDDMDMTGLWESEQHDILIPAWVSKETEI